MSNSTKVPFVDLGSSLEGLAPAILADVADLFESGAFTNGPGVAEFEDRFAAYCGSAH